MSEAGTLPGRTALAPDTLTCPGDYCTMILLDEEEGDVAFIMEKILSGSAPFWGHAALENHSLAV